MMMSAFQTNIAAYALLLKQCLIQSFCFFKRKEMADKHDYMQQFTVDSNHEIAKTVIYLFKRFATFAISKMF